MKKRPTGANRIISFSQISCSTAQLTVTATPGRITTSSGNDVSLFCAASEKPILCLWKTPYGHVYTLSEGVFAESGRLRHINGDDDSCGLEIVGVEDRDRGRWECEVGAIIGEDFRTTTDAVVLDVKSKIDLEFRQFLNPQQQKQPFFFHRICKLQILPAVTRLRIMSCSLELYYVSGHMRTNTHKHTHMHVCVCYTVDAA